MAGLFFSIPDSKTFIDPAPHIFLTGFMGSGKTTLGKKLAPMLGLPFVDLDVFIEEYEKKDITTIFEEQGENTFRQLEANYLKEIITHKPHLVSLGGGTICFEDNLNLVKNNGLLVYLDLPVTVLADRLAQAKQKRPLFNGLSQEEVPQRIKELLNQRLVYYKQAHLIVNALNLTPKNLHKQIVECIKK